MPQDTHYNWLWPYVKNNPLRRAIDCGAHKGEWTEAWTKRVQTIEAFEPNTEVLPLFKERAKNFTNVNLYEHALGDTSGTVAMDYETHLGTYHIVSKEGPYKIKTLDSYNFTDVDIMKIDVEGYEIPLLDGARHTIMTNRPWIQIEANETGAKFYNRPKKQILDKLISFGMKRIVKQWPDQIWSF